MLSLFQWMCVGDKLQHFTNWVLQTTFLSSFNSKTQNYMAISLTLQMTDHVHIHLYDMDMVGHLMDNINEIRSLQFHWVCTSILWSTLDDSFTCRVFYTVENVLLSCILHKCAQSKHTQIARILDKTTTIGHNKTQYKITQIAAGTKHWWCSRYHYIGIYIYVMQSENHRKRKFPYS